jgi:hypothetical protein
MDNSKSNPASSRFIDAVAVEFGGWFGGDRSMGKSYLNDEPRVNHVKLLRNSGIAILLSAP